MTIKEIAAKAGVSIATVSHVINHTRYVSPELVDKIEAIIEESGYSEKIKKKVRKIRSGRSSQIIAVFPNIKSALYCDLCNQLQSYATSQGYQFYTAVTNDSPEEEKSILQNLISSAKTIGIFLSPASSNPAAYAFLYESGIPFVCVERFIDDDVTPRILFDYTKAFHSATSYFFESGHENVLFLVEKTDSLGEHAVSPDSIRLSKEEKQLLRTGNYRVAISFHCTGTAWAALHQKGIRDELEQYGIDIISTMDAHFDPALQNMQLESIKMQHPDAVIAIPTDDVQTGPAFQELSKMTRLVFLSNVPQNFSRNNYVSCISVNERENGTNTGRMIGEYLKEKPHAKVGFIIHGAMFYGTTERDNCAEKILRESYPDIEITARKGFIQIENAYKVCYEMINEHPDIQALYVSWDRPALLAIKALKALNRTDIAVFTTDLDFEIAEEMNQGFVKGLSTQRPYDQGKAAALAVAKSLVSDNVPKYIGVQPYVVHEKQLKRAWKDIFFEALPEELG